MGVPSPTVDLTECRSRNRMAESTLDRVDALTSLLEATNNLRDVVGVDVTEAKLTVLVVFTNRVDMALFANEEAKVVAA